MENTNNNSDLETKLNPSANDDTERISASAAPVFTPDSKKPAKKLHKSLIVVMVILAVLALAGTGFGVYGMLSGDSKVADLEQKIAEQEQIIKELRSEPSDQPTQPDEGEQEPDMSNPNVPDLAKQLLISNMDQFINWGKGPFVYELRSVYGEFSVYLERQVGSPIEGPEGEISLPHARLSGSIERTDFNGLERREEFEITGLDNDKIVDVFVSGFGNGMGDETMFFLMDDGTVEYMPIWKAYKAKNYHSYGKLPNVENVIKFMRGDYWHIPHGSYANTFAQRADGKFYSLDAILRSTGNY